MNEIQKQKAEGMFSNLSDQITSGDIDTKLLSAQSDILGKAKTKLSRFFEEFVLLFNLIRDYKNEHYTEIPWRCIASVGGAILYFFMPIDAIPDFIPIAGFVDDSAVVGLVLSMFKSDMEKYKAWKQEHHEEITIGDVSIYSDPDDEKFNMLEKNCFFQCDTMSYEKLVSELVTKKPTDVNFKKAAVLRTNLDDDGQILVTTYMNENGDYIWGNDPEKPYGWIYKIKNIDEELDEAFGDEDMIVFE